MNLRKKLAVGVAVIGAVAAMIGGGLAYASTRTTAAAHSAGHRGPDQASLRHKPAQPPPAPGTPRWSILESGPDAQSLVISVGQKTTAAGCPMGARATATETATTIHVHVTGKYQHFQACTADLKAAIIRVTLPGPIDGRKIEGDGLFWPTGAGVYLEHETSTGLVVPEVPRVIGLRLDQAALVLRAQNFLGKPADSHGTTVVAQSPGRGQVPLNTNPAHQFSGTVWLTTGS